MASIIKADLIFINGNVITMNELSPEANAIAVKNGSVLYVGETEDVLTLKGEQTEVVDLQGKTIMPGFVESHTHTTGYGNNLLQVDCRPAQTPSIDDILAKLKDAVEATPEGEWIRGWGWDDSRLAEKRNPTRWDLDKVAPNHPVFLKRTCGHVAVGNSKALEISGITKDTPDPDGGHIQLDKETGEPTGILQELAQGLVSLPKLTKEDVARGLKLAQKDYAKWGITTLHDMSTQKIDMEVFQMLKEQNELTVRVRPWIWAMAQRDRAGLLDEMITLGLHSNLGGDMVKIQGMKFMLDGSVGGRTAATAEPYEDDDSKGILYYDKEHVAPYMKRAVEAGLRVAIHGIGERAIDVALESFKEAHQAVDISKMRNRIEHCGLPTEDHLKTMKELNMIAASSIGFIYHLGDSYIRNLGPERMKRVYPQKTFKEYGIVAPGNSDLPVTDGNPWLGIYAAVNRKTVSGQVTDTVQNISVYDAIKAYTVDAAYSSFEEDTLGIIKENAKADLMIVSDNPFEIDTEALKDITVEATYLGGKKVYG